MRRKKFAGSGNEIGVPLKSWFQSGMAAKIEHKNVAPTCSSFLREPFLRHPRQLLAFFALLEDMPLFENCRRFPLSIVIFDAFANMPFGPNPDAMMQLTGSWCKELLFHSGKCWCHLHVNN